MRVYLILFCLLSIPFFVESVQNQVPPDVPDETTVQLVRNTLQQPQGMSVSFSEKRLDRLGDKISGALLVIFTEEELVRPENVRRFLPLIRSTFRNPELISQAEDRNPRRTLALLRRLDADVTDPTLRGEILDITNIVIERTSSYR